LLASAPGFDNWKISHNPAPFDKAFDFLVTGTAAKGTKLELWVECKADPRPVMFPYVGIEKKFEGTKTKVARARVFGAPRIGPRMAETCWNHGWGWFDLAGNCRIGVPGIVYLERSGNAPIAVSTARPRANLGSPETGRIIRTLLAQTDSSIQRWTHQMLRQACSPTVSIGLVNKVVRFLRDERYVEYIKLPEEGFRLVDPVGLLTAWRDAYRFDRHDRRGYFTLLKGAELNRALARLGDDGWVLAAFSAADSYLRYSPVRQPKTWLFISAALEDEFRKAVEAKPVDSGENLVVLIPDDMGIVSAAGGMWKGSDAGSLPATTPVQTYVDLWHGGGRGQEAAEAMLKQLTLDWNSKGFAR
jgi:hypothetical protein